MAVSAPMHGRWLRLLPTLLAMACAGHAGIDAPSPSSAVPWTSLEAEDAPEDFDFVVVTDRTGDHREGVFREAMGKVNLLQPAFVVSVGDLIEGYTEDRAELAAQWDEMAGMIGTLEMPFFYAAGNHDISNAVMAEVWRERFGPSYYHFTYKDVLFVVLNSELFSQVSRPGRPVGGPDTQAEQMAWLERVLAERRDARWTMVFVHQPLWDLYEIREDWQRVEAWLGSRPYTVFAGHLHRYTSHLRHDRKYLTLATTGGGSALRGLDRGEFDHLLRVSMTRDGPVFANLMLDGIHDEDVRSEAIRGVTRRLDRAVVVEPQLAGEGAFTGGSLRLRVRNEGDAPLTYSAKLYASSDLQPVAGTLSGAVPAGEVETLEVAFAAKGRPSFETLAPASARFTLGTSLEDRPIEVEVFTWLLPERRFEVPRAEAAVTVDGDLSEWPILPHVVEERPARTRDPEAVVFRFGLRHDDEFLYLAVDVADSTPYSSTELSARRQDAVSIVLDARPDPERSTNEGFFEGVGNGAVRQMLFAWLAPVAPASDPIFDVLLPHLPEGVVSVTQRTTTGYAGEIAIPLGFLDERQGGPWQAFRLEVTAQDFATDGAARGARAWRPSRFGFSGVLPAEGSGTFVRR